MKIDEDSMKAVPVATVPAVPVQAAPGKPTFRPAEACDLARRFYGLEARAQPLVSYCDQNFRLDDRQGRRWVLKLANVEDPPPWLLLQNRAIDWLGQRQEETEGFALPKAQPSLAGRWVEHVDGADGAVHGLRLLTWVPGAPWDTQPLASPDRCRQLGALVATVVEGLRDFEDPSMHRPMSWDPLRLPAARDKLEALDDPRQRSLAARLLDRFEGEILNRLRSLPAQVIHADINNTNVLLGPRGEIVGLIDFGDVVHTVRVAELGIAVAYAMLEQRAPLAVATAVLRGYGERTTLLPEEADLVLEVALARLVMSVLSSAAQLRLDPTNTYLGICQKPAWVLLEQLAPRPGQGLLVLD